MGYRLRTTIKVFEGDSHEEKPTDDVPVGSKLTELDTGKEFVAAQVGIAVEAGITIEWLEVQDSQLTALGSQLVSLNVNGTALLQEIRRANLISERVHNVEVSVEDVES